MKLIMGVITTVIIITISIGIIISTSETPVNPSQSADQTISLYEIISHPYNYLNKTVTIKSYYYGNIHAIEWQHWIKEDSQRLYFRINGSSVHPTLICGAKYYFNGIFRCTENCSYIPYYLENTTITAIEPLPTKPYYTISEVETYAYQFLEQEITILAAYYESSSFLRNTENFELLPGAKYFFTGSIFIDSTYGFPYCRFAITEVSLTL